MLGRRTSLVALIYEPKVAPLAVVASYVLGAVGSTGSMTGYVFRGDSTHTSATVVWEKSTDSGETFTAVTHGGTAAISYVEMSAYGASSSRYRGKTYLIIGPLVSGDYGLYRIKAIDSSSGATLTAYSENFDFSNPV